MPIITVVLNTQNESLEITRRVRAPEYEIKRIEKQMETLAIRLYQKLSKRRDRGHQRVMIGLARSNEELNAADLIEHKDIIHYTLYEGRCLEPQKLSYFLKEKTIDEGDLSLKEIRKILT